MATFVILSRISPEAFDDPKDFKDIGEDQTAMSRCYLEG